MGRGFDRNRNWREDARSRKFQVMKSFFDVRGRSRPWQGCHKKCRNFPKIHQFETNVNTVVIIWILLRGELTSRAGFGTFFNLGVSYPLIHSYLYNLVSPEYGFLVSYYVILIYYVTRCQLIVNGLLLILCTILLTSIFIWYLSIFPLIIIQEIEKVRRNITYVRMVS